MQGLKDPFCNPVGGQSELEVLVLRTCASRINQLTSLSLLCKWYGTVDFTVSLGKRCEAIHVMKLALVINKR